MIDNNIHNHDLELSTIIPGSHIHGNDVYNSSGLIIPQMLDSNCSIIWRKQHQIAIDNKTLFDATRWDLENMYPFGSYLFPTVFKGTFSYWLSHIESQHRLHDKAFFADKFLVKKYIYKLREKYALFNEINTAQILYDLTNVTPTFYELKMLHENNEGFVFKPNHFSGKQIIFDGTGNITKKRYNVIRALSRSWLKRKYRKMNQGINREPWYELIKPRVFIEEYLRVNTNDTITQKMEYFIHVFNYKPLFCTVGQDQLIQDQGNSQFTKILSIENIYILPEFKLLNVSWSMINDETATFTLKSRRNLDIMIQFAHHFAQTEKWKYVRVDFMEIDGKIYFSEFTFATWSGIGLILPISFDYLLYNILCEDNKNDIKKMYQYLHKSNSKQITRVQNLSMDVHNLLEKLSAWLQKYDLDSKYVLHT